MYKQLKHASLVNITELVTLHCLHKGVDQLEVQVMRDALVREEDKLHETVGCMAFD